MSEFLAGIPVGDVSFAIIVFGAIVSIIRGDLVPRKTHEDVLKDRDDWKGIALDLLQVSHKAVEAAEVTANVVKAVPNPLPLTPDQARETT